MNANRTDGYVTDVAYTANCFVEHAPTWLNYAAVLNGCRPRPLEHGFTCIDLGCGLGDTLNVAAAAFPQGEFYGVDFNPVHIAAAKEHALRWQSENVTFIADSFQNLPKTKLPEFDFIILHGIYSWVSEDARRAVLEFIRDRLKPGGILHLSYNCMPGWAEVAPLQKLLFELGEAAGGNSVNRITQAIPQLGRLAALPAGFLAEHPVALRLVRELGQLDQSYVAHEYLNANWRPRYSSDVMNEMRALGLDYIGLGIPVENHPNLMLPDMMAALVASQPTEALMQLATDYLLNRSFRRDIYVRGHDRLDSVERSRLLRDFFFTCPTDPRVLLDEVVVPRGKFRVERTLARELKAAFATGSLMLEDVIARIPRSVASAAEIEEAVTCLVAGARLMPAALRNTVSGAISRTRLAIPLAANRQVIGEVSKVTTEGLSGLLHRKFFLVSPVAGNGIPIDGVDAQVLLLRSESAMPAKAVATAVRDRLVQGMVKGRAKLGTLPDEDTIERLVRTTLKIVVPSLQRLGIVSPG